MAGWLLHWMRSDSKLVLLMSTLMTWLGLDQMTVEHRWLGLFDLASRNLHNDGKPGQAIRILEQVVQMRE